MGLIPRSLRRKAQKVVIPADAYFVVDKETESFFLHPAGDGAYEIKLDFQGAAIWKGAEYVDKFLNVMALHEQYKPKLVSEVLHNL